MTVFCTNCGKALTQRSRACGHSEHPVAPSSTIAHHAEPGPVLIRSGGPYPSRRCGRSAGRAPVGTVAGGGAMEAVSLESSTILRC